MIIFTTQLILMAVTSFLNLPKTALRCKSPVCKACGLYLNQLPVIDAPQKSNIFWVGLSAVQLNDNEIVRIPLSPSTRSGGLIHQIEEPFYQKTGFYKTNLVKCLPLKNDKIRYPLEDEMEKCYPNFEFELEVLQPKLVFLLGKQVASFVFKKKLGIPAILPDDFRYTGSLMNGVLYVPVHHPSFILVYKRKQVATYINNIQALFSIHKTKPTSRVSHKKMTTLVEE